MDIFYRSIETEVDILSSKVQPDKEYFNELATVWRNLGLSEEQREPRRDKCQQHINELMSAMVEEEKEMEQKIIADVADYQVELDNLCNEMEKSCEMVSVLY